MDTRENDWHTPVPTHGLAKQLKHAQSHIIHVLTVMVYTAVFSLLGRIWTWKSGVGPLLPAEGNSKSGVTWPLVSMSAISTNPMLLLTRTRYYSVIVCFTPSIFKKLSSARWIWISYNHAISNKREWNNCFINNAHKISRNPSNFVCKNRFSACF